MNNFQACIPIILEHEGGYVNDPNDPGGETQFGISKRAYPDLDIKNLTVEDAVAIYLKDYWEPIRGDLLPLPVALCLFDAAVNQGVTRSVIFLQEVVKVGQDGIIGPVTARAASKNPMQTVERFMTRRIEHYASLRTWKHYSTGWTKRILRTYKTAIEMERKNAEINA